MLHHSPDRLKLRVMTSPRWSLRSKNLGIPAVFAAIDCHSFKRVLGIKIGFTDKLSAQC